jgi:hypothetical protein
MTMDKNGTEREMFIRVLLVGIAIVLDFGGKINTKSPSNFHVRNICEIR